MLRIGAMELKSPFLLAPIAGYCDLAFRLTCRSFDGPGPDGRWLGLGLACTDLLSPQGLLRGSARSLDLARTHDLDTPICMQLYGGAPDVMGDGAAWAVDHGAAVVDINMGCPVDKVTKKDGGSKLLCDPENAERILERVRNVVERRSGGAVPVTVKMRLGWFTDQPVAVKLAPRLVAAGAQAVTIHGRSTEQKFRGDVDLNGIRAVVEAVGDAAPVIGNGDVRSPEDAVAMMRVTGARGVMIGRGALSRPWLFRDCAAAVSGAHAPPEPSLAEKAETIRGYFERMREFRDDGYAMNHIRRRISWFAKSMDGGKARREAIRTANRPADVHAALDDWSVSCEQEQNTQAKLALSSNMGHGICESVA